MGYHSAIGKSIHDLDTPALILDLDICLRNLKTMSDFFSERPTQVRPHFKNHKCTQLARLQIESGSAVGMTCSQIDEAEALARAEFSNILIANQVVGAGKITRLMRVADQTNLALAVDDPNQAKNISDAAVMAGVTVGLLLEVDIGMGRCGVQPGDSALRIAQEIVRLPNTELRGIQAYEGHLVSIDDWNQRDTEVRASMQQAVDTQRLLKQHGISAPTISGGSSSTYKITGTMEGITEIQAGSYATMDWKYHQLVPEFGIALSVMATVVSLRENVAVLDVGIKRLGSEFGLPRIKNWPDVTLPFFAAEEHCVVEGVSSWKVGNTMQVQGSHGCTTCNLHPEMFVYQQDKVVDVWPIDGRRVPEQ